MLPGSERRVGLYGMVLTGFGSGGGGIEGDSVTDGVAWGCGYEDEDDDEGREENTGE